MFQFGSGQELMVNQIVNNINLGAGTQDFFGAGPQKHSAATVPRAMEVSKKKKRRRDKKKRHQDQGGNGQLLFLIRLNVRIRANLIFTVAGRGQAP